MSAVGDEAKGLLATVQAAREVAHDEDVVKPAAKATEEEPAEETPAEEAGGEASASEGEVASSEEPESAEVEASSEGESSGAEEEASSGDDHDHDDEEEFSYSPDNLLDPWTGEDIDVARGTQAEDLDGEEEGAANAGEADDGASAPTDDSVAEIHGATAEAEDEAEDAEEDAEEDDQEAGSAEADDESGDSNGSTPEEGNAVAGSESETEARPRPSRRRRRRGGRRGAAASAASSGDGGGVATAEDPEGSATGEAEPVETSDNDDGGSEGEKGGSRRRDGRKNGRRGGRSGRRGGRGGKSGARDSRQMPAIEDVLQKGQEIIVQVIKDGIGTKGPTLTTYLSIPGRFIVLMPGIQKRGVSRKVSSNADRERLKKIVGQLEAPDGLGFIVRTAGSGCSQEDLQRDLDYLLRLWEQMQTRSVEHKAPVLLYQENDLVIRTLRDLYDGEGEIVIDDEATADTAREFIGQIMPEKVEKIQTYAEEKPLFSHYGIETELGRLLESRLELKSGASLVIEQTEALVAIDVNSGRFKPTQTKSIDDTAFAVNCEAAVEIARQLRLRDLGGVVVLDFIDMRFEKHRKQLERLFKDELRKDRARIKVARFSPFGILEMTRQRVRPSLKRTVHQKCPYCESTGFIPSDETSCLATVRKVRENLWRPGSVLVVTVRPEVAEAVLNTQKKLLVELEIQGGKQIFVRADHRLAYEDIEVRAMIALPDDVDHRRA